MSTFQVQSLLDDEQQRLLQHFTALKQRRTAQSLPVFSIEHGLNAESVERIRNALHWRLANHDSLDRHWLCWVVYATELGYHYDGDEYWQSFEKRTPHWRDDLDRRHKLREWFQKFQEKFGGFKPHSTWATHFSIICWPITHALLPRDLQTQLAEAIYKVRVALARRIDRGPLGVGELLKLHADDGSSRYRNFLEQTELAGRIVFELLKGESEDGVEYIEPTTLKRIVKDLEASHEGKLWLRETKKTIADRIRIVGTGPRTGVGATPLDTSLQRTLQDSRLAATVKPSRYLLRSDNRSWVAITEIPSFKPIAEFASELGSFIRQTRCKAQGAGDVWLPKGWLLFGTQRKPLQVWPKDTKPAIEFEKPQPFLMQLLAADCRYSPGPVWLYKIQRDGTATEVIGRTVRTEQRYVIVNKTPLQETSWLKPALIETKGVYAYEFQVARANVSEISEGLRVLGLTIASELTVWTAGLSPPRSLDDDTVEWLSDEPLTLGISHDDGIEALEVTLNGRTQPIDLDSIKKLPLFLSVGTLAEGIHSVVFLATLKLATTIQKRLSIHVRPRKRWTPGTPNYHGVSVRALPSDPSLDRFLDGKVSISIEAPEGQETDVALELLNASGGLLRDELIWSFRAPVSQVDFARHLDEFTRKERDPEKLLDATSARVRITCHGLGTTYVQLLHEQAPLRWTVAGTKRLAIQLRNDTGHPEETVIQEASYKRPSQLRKLQLGQLASCAAICEGGLLTAITGKARASIVISRPGKLHSFAEIYETPEVGPPLRTGEAVLELLEMIRDWSAARLVGPIASMRRAKALTTLADQLVASICSQSWTDAERAYRTMPDSQRDHALRRVCDTVGGSLQYAQSLVNEPKTLLADTLAQTATNFENSAVLYRLPANPSLIAAIVRLVFTPDTFADAYGDKAIKVLNEIVNNKTVLHGARLVALLVETSELKHQVGSWE
jgi:hypothetical protein